MSIEERSRKVGDLVACRLLVETGSVTLRFIPEENAAKWESIMQEAVLAGFEADKDFCPMLALERAKRSFFTIVSEPNPHRKAEMVEALG